MARELMPDFAAEALCGHPIQENVFEGPEKPRKEADHRAVFCKEATPCSFDTRRRAAVAGGVKNLFNDEVSLIDPSGKDVFAFRKI